MKQTGGLYLQPITFRCALRVTTSQHQPCRVYDLPVDGAETQGISEAVWGLKRNPMWCRISSINSCKLQLMKHTKCRKITCTWWICQEVTERLLEGSAEAETMYPQKSHLLQPCWPHKDSKPTLTTNQPLVEQFSQHKSYIPRTRTTHQHGNHKRGEKHTWNKHH